MIKNILLVFIALLIIFCTEKPTEGTVDETDTQIALSGRVVDSLGVGVFGAIARLKISGFSDTTDTLGKYEIKVTKGEMDSVGIDVDTLNDTLEIIKNLENLGVIPIVELKDSILDVIYVIDPRLIGYWDFNEGSGDTLHDATENGNHGIIHGAVWVVGHDGYALHFSDADSSLVVIPATSVLEPTPPFTMELIVWGDSVQSNPNAAILRKSINVDNGYALYWGNENDKITFDIDYHGTSVFDNDSISKRSDMWNHLIVEIRDSSTSMYINGTLVMEKDTLSTMLHSNDLHIGGGMFGLHRCFFNGKIDDIKFFSDTLGASEILNRYNNLGLE